MSLDVEPALVIRADGGPSVGGGHIMRSLALAQEWRLRGGTVDYLIPPEAKGFEERLLDEGIRVHCIDPAGDENGGVTADVARECGASWVILDGYRFSPSFHATLRECSPELGILSVDDNRDYRDYSSNIVLNTNPYASEELYKGVESKLLLGSRFALLRSEFRLLAGRPAPVSGPVTTVVVSMGASDPDNATTDVLAALNGTGFDGELRVILGPGYRHAEPTLPRGGTLLRSVADMSAEFRRADLVIGGSGSTCWELCYLGRAMVAVVLAENQRRVGESLQPALAAEVAFASEDIGSAIERALSAGAAERLATAAASLIDGMGASRVVAEMQGAPFWLRRVASTDAERLF
ncbi:MAG: UDP-2,4-diacetamido-2,4,6-trideoxy-beta-L-altropyranose hydrolase, partial [Myxococcota bacterium]